MGPNFGSVNESCNYCCHLYVHRRCRCTSGCQNYRKWQLIVRKCLQLFGYLFICWLECVHGCHWNGIAQPWLFSVELVWSVLGTVNQVSQSMRIEVRTDCVDVKWKHWVYQTYKFKCYFGTLLFWDLCHVHVDWRLDLQTWDMLRVHIRDLLVPVRHNTYVTGETHVTAACP